MRVLDSDLCAIVLSLCHELGLQPGGRVRLATLGERWQQVGLRRFDLESAVGMLLRDGCFEREPETQPPHTFRLTEHGYVQMQRAASRFAQYFSRHQRVRRLAERRRAVASADPGDTGRRRRD